jgi:ribosomal-protein-alanine N-acetyltransferase
VGTPRSRRCHITAMTDADLDDVMEIERLAFKSPWSRQVFVEELQREWARLDVLRDRERGPVRAFTNYWLVRDEVHLLNLSVHPDARRKGYGAALLEHVIEFARRHRCRYITLEVRKSNLGAIHLYEQHGFRRVGVRPNYYQEDQEDAIVMLLELPVSAG